MKYFFEAREDLNRNDFFSLYINAIALQFDPHTSYLAPSAKERFDQNISRKVIDRDFCVHLRSSKGLQWSRIFCFENFGIIPSYNRLVNGVCYFYFICGSRIITLVFKI